MGRQICGDRPDLAATMGPDHPVLAFAPAMRKIVYTTDEIDKRNLRRRATCNARERPRDEARRVGCNRRQASYSFLAGLRRSRAWPFGGRALQRSTKRA